MNHSIFKNASTEHCPVFLKPEIFEIGRRNINQNPRTQELVSIFEILEVAFREFSCFFRLSGRFDILPSFYYIFLKSH
jgi:hypothetical protein